MRLLLVLTLLLVGCRERNTGYCGDCGIPVACTDSSPGCVCLNNVCVECTANDESNCGNTRPQCGDNNVCRACRSNDECNDSGACLEDGSCAAVDRVIYASPNGPSSGDCSKGSACSLPHALTVVNAPRDIIRLAPGTYVVPSGTVDGLDFSPTSATLIARDATLTRTTISGAIISVRNGQTLKLVGGTLQGPSNTTDGIKCIENSKLAVHEVTIDGMTQSGIETNQCQLTVSRSTLRNNDLGGINMTAASVATITNNFVYRNGGAASPFGGLGLKLAAGSKLEFNTVVDNNADASSPAAGMASGGIACEGQGYDAPFNLVYRNVGGIGGGVQVLGTCTFTGSYQQKAESPGENVVGFENPAGGTPSYRLTEASPPGTIRDAFDCNDIDFERDGRPSPSRAMGGKCDFGADEYREGQ
jgi:Right handed beta helix region